MTTTQTNEQIESIKPIGEKMSLSTPPTNTPEKMNQRFPDPMHPFGPTNPDPRQVYREHGWLFGGMMRGRR